MKINMGGRSIYAVEGVIAEGHGQCHYKVPLEQINNRDGRVVGGSFLMVNYPIIFSEIKNAGIVFSGPAPFDADGKCMRFMFERDALAFYEAFKGE